jgi:hypothetical protein
LLSLSKVDVTVHSLRHRLFKIGMEGRKVAVKLEVMDLIRAVVGDQALGIESGIRCNDEEHFRESA